MRQISGKASLVERISGIVASSKRDFQTFAAFTEQEHLWRMLTLFKRTPVAGIVLPLNSNHLQHCT